MLNMIYRRIAYLGANAELAVISRCYFPSSVDEVSLALLWQGCSWTH